MLYLFDHICPQSSLAATAQSMTHQYDFMSCGGRERSTVYICNSVIIVVETISISYKIQKKMQLKKIEVVFLLKSERRMIHLPSHFKQKVMWRCLPLFRITPLSLDRQEISAVPIW